MMKMKTGVFWIGWVGLVALSAVASPKSKLSPRPRAPRFEAAKVEAPKIEVPTIQSLIKPKLWKTLTEEREILTDAALTDIPDSLLKTYTFYAAMLVNASASRAKEVLTDYKLYSELIPFIQKSEYSAANQTLSIAGGIWNFKTASVVKFTEKSDRWIRFRVVGGHFTGLEGNVLFEPYRKKENAGDATLVYFNGELNETQFPPKFIIEQGAQVVFRYTALKMRSKIEEKKKVQGSHESNRQLGPESDGEPIPQPRGHL